MINIIFLFLAPIKLTLLTDKYADKNYGTITCYDRMIIQGYIPRWSYADGMTSYLNS